MAEPLASTDERSPRVLWALLVCLLAAFVLRAYGASFGLPDLYYWDEPTVVNRAVRFGSGDLNPHAFYYPAFYKYVLFAMFGVYFAVARVAGVYRSAEDFAATYFIDPTNVYLVARLTTAAVSTATVLVAYLVGKRYFDWRVGLAAAIFLAVSPLQASYAHVAVTDSAHTLFILAALLPLALVIEQGRPRDYALSGLLIGIGAATKYLAVLHVATLVLAHGLRDPLWAAGRPGAARLAREALAPRLWLGLAAAGAGFFVGSPYNVLDAGAFLRDFASQAGLSKGDGEVDWILLRSLPLDLGWPLCLLGAWGAARLVRRLTRAQVVLFVFPVLYGLCMLPMARGFERYLLPQAPFVCLLAAYGLFDLCARLAPERSRWLATALGAAAVALPAARTVQWDWVMARGPDTRAQARLWTETHVPAGTKVAVQSLFERSFDNVPLVTDRTLARLESIIPASGSFGRVRDRALAAWRGRSLYEEIPWTGDPEPLHRSGARYVFLTNLYGAPPPRLAAWLAQNAVREVHFDPALPGTLGWLPPLSRVVAVVPPRITVYEIGDGVGYARSAAAPPAAPW